MSAEWIPSAEWRVIDQTIVSLAKQKGELEVEIGRWLLAALRERVDRRCGYGSFTEYVERRLGWDGRILREKLRVARALEKMPRMQALLERGERSWSAVRELVRVATPETESDWIEKTERMTVRQIEACVSGRKAGELPTEVKDPLLVPRRMSFELWPEDFALIEEAFEEVRREIGASASRIEAFRAMAERVLGKRPERQASYQTSLTVCVSCERAWQRAGGTAVEVSPANTECARCDGEVNGFTEIDEGIVNAETALGDHDSSTPHVGRSPDLAPREPSQHDQLSATPHVGRSPERSARESSQHDHNSATPHVGRSLERAPQELSQHDHNSAAPHVGRSPDLRELSQHDQLSATPHVGRSPDLREGSQHEQSLDAPHVGREEDDAERRTIGARRLLRMASKMFGLPLKSMSPRLRGLVRARDRGRCVVPGCTNFRFVDLHHHRARKDGGPNTLENLYSLCTAHHRAVHEGVLAIEGSPSDGLVIRHAGGVLYGDSAWPKPTAGAAAADPA